MKTVLKCIPNLFESRFEQFQIIIDVHNSHWAQQGLTESIKLSAITMSKHERLVIRAKTNCCYRGLLDIIRDLICCKMFMKLILYNWNVHFI